MSNQLAFAFGVVEPTSQALTSIDEAADSLGHTDSSPSLVDSDAPSSTHLGHASKARTSRVAALEPPQEADRPATLQDSLTCIEAQIGTNDPEVKAIRGALTTFLMVVQRESDRRKAAQLDLLARGADLRGAFRSALPAAFRISRSRWSNMKRLLGNLLIATGWIDPTTRRQGSVTPAYQALAAMKPKGGVHSSLLPFLRFCERRGTPPEVISLADLNAYETWLIDRTLDPHPQQTIRSLEGAWRRLQRICPEWPQQGLRTPSRRWQKALDIGSFPASFGTDLHALLAVLRNPDPLDPDNGRPMAELSVRHVRRHLLRAATYLVQAGTPITDVSKRLALTLNAEGVAGPRGGKWSSSSINGHRSKGTGILNNELYRGRLTWHRRRWLKDPNTGRRLARTNDVASVVSQDVPELRIVPDALWQAVKARQASLDRKGAALGRQASHGAFWTKQRPKYLFSGLMVCGECGGGFSKISASHFGCSTARNKGPTACINRLTVRRDVLEDTVLTALRERLMDPDLFRDFVG
jgi:hypothetical protein